MATNSQLNKMPLAQQSERSVRLRIFSNLGLQYANSLLNLVSGLVLVKLLSNHLGVEGYGTYNLVLGFVVAFQVLTDWGITTVALREIAKDRSRLEQIIGNLFLLRAIMSLGAAAICFFTALLFGYGNTVMSSISLFTVFLLLSPLDVFSLVFQVDLRGSYTVLPAMLSTVLNLSLISGAVFLGLSVNYIFAIVIFSNILRLLLVFNFSRRYVSLNFEPDLSLWRDLLGGALPIGFSALVVAIYGQIDLMMLSWLDSAYAVGIYSAGLRLTNFVAFIPLAVAGTLFPLFAAYYLQSPEKLHKLYQQTLDLMLMLALPMAVSFSLLAGNLIELLLKTDFAPSSLVLALNIWTTALGFLSIIAGQALIAINLARINFLLQLVSLTIDVGLNLLLIKSYSYLGATIANFASFMLLGSITILIFSKKVAFRYNPQKALIIGVATFCFGFTLFYLRDFNWFVALIFSGVLYLVLMWWFNVLNLTELRLMLKPS
jgi:O-antigen/teichoic acid export membrane protein